MRSRSLSTAGRRRWGRVFGRSHWSGRWMCTHNEGRPKCFDRLTNTWRSVVNTYVGPNTPSCRQPAQMCLLCTCTNLFDDVVQRRMATRKFNLLWRRLPQIRVNMLIGSQANYEIKTKITIYFYKVMISYEKYSTLNLYSHKINRNIYLQLFIK